jgi:hypothetical protein
VLDDKVDLYAPFGTETYPRGRERRRQAEQRASQLPTGLSYQRFARAMSVPLKTDASLEHSRAANFGTAEAPARPTTGRFDRTRADR